MSGVVYRVFEKQPQDCIYQQVCHDRLYFFMKNQWLKFKKDPHIGLPLTKKDSKWIISYVTNPGNISTHKFTPLLHRSILQRRYRPEKDALKNESGKRQRTVGEKKIRNIYYCSHIDSMIYGYYNHLLTIQYENYINDKPYNSVAAAYRKIPINPEHSNNKCNIEFAFEVFEFIENHKDLKLSILVTDITSFFDNLDHRLLHKRWKRILQVETLPDDHYALFRNLISKRYVNEYDLFKRFQNKLIVERFKPNDKTQKEFKRKHIKKFYNIRKENVVAFCKTQDFFKEAVDLIRVEKPLNNAVREVKGRKTLKGIPQGTPISATLSNIYMIDFDENIFREISLKDGFYQRYCDDLVVICDQKDEDFFIQLLVNEIESQAKLEIQREKTKLYRYELYEDSGFKGGLVDNDEINYNKQLEYLGFEYDGAKVRVKSASFSRFYRNMNRAFNRGAHFAMSAYTPSNSLFEARLYKRFTHRGSNRRLKYVKDPNNPNKFIRTTLMEWGNFISYLNKANSVMKKINGENTIIKQYSNIWNKFHELKKQTYTKIAECKKTL